LGTKCCKIKTSLQNKMATKDNNTLIAVGGLAVVFGAAWWNHNRIINAKSSTVVPIGKIDDL
jgi:hypothetical protein